MLCGMTNSWLYCVPVANAVLYLRIRENSFISSIIQERELVIEVSYMREFSTA